VEGHALDGPEALQRVGDERLLVLAHLLHPDALQELDGAAEPDALGHSRGPGLELRRQGAPARPVLQRDRGDHVPAAEKRRHRLEQLATPVQDADAGRAVGLVARPRVEVRVDRADVDRELRHGLRSVDDDDRARGVRTADDLVQRVDRAQDVGHVRDRNDLDVAARELLVELVQQEPALVVDAHPVEYRAGATRRDLPWHEVRVVLHLGDQDAVARAEIGAAPRVGDEVERLGGVAREDRLA